MAHKRIFTALSLIVLRRFVHRWSAKKLEGRLLLRPAIDIDIDYNSTLSNRSKSSENDIL